MYGDAKMIERKRNFSLPLSISLAKRGIKTRERIILVMFQKVKPIYNGIFREIFPSMEQTGNRQMVLIYKYCSTESLAKS
jgi:hypothetical protein